LIWNPTPIRLERSGRIFSFAKKTKRFTKSVKGFPPRQHQAMTGSLSLHDYPGGIVRLSCEKCGRAGQYRKENLIKRFGPDIQLPDLREYRTVRASWTKAPRLHGS
jgi:hypothetical protein